MSIHAWPESQRPREKLLARGADKLSDAELLALFLGSGLAGCNAVETARRVLHEAGGLRALLEMPPPRQRQLPGIGLARQALLSASLELGRRYLGEPLTRGKALTQPADAAQYLNACLRGHRHEIFACLFLDNKHRMLAYEEIFQGTIDSAAVYPREVLRRAMAHNAAAVILAHNHPSGVAEPSEADRSITEKLIRTLDLVDIRVLDHLIIGDGTWTSLRERDWPVC